MGMAGSRKVTSARSGFRSWLLKQTGRDDAVGDVARAVAEDTCADHLHTAFRLWKHVRDEHDAPSTVLDALNDAEREFMREHEQQLIRFMR